MSTTINKSNTCVIVGSYPQDHLDTTLVSLTIESFKRQGYDICLTSHTPVSNDLQKASKYYIYSDENYTLNFPSPSSIATYFANSEIHYSTNLGNRMGAHSLAILMNMKNALYLLKNKKYKNFIYVECDTFLNSEDHKILENKLVEFDFENKNFWFMIEGTTNMVIPVTTIFGGNIEFFNEKFSTIETEEDYIEIGSSVGGYSLEAIFSFLFCRTPLENGILSETRPRDLFSSKWLGISNYGNISIPELEDTFNIEADIVKQKGGLENYVFFVIPQYPTNVQIGLKMYRDNVLIDQGNITTGALHYWMFEKGETQKWKFEIYHQDKLIKVVERTTENIFWNKWSFFELKNLEG